MVSSRCQRIVPPPTRCRLPQDSPLDPFFPNAKRLPNHESAVRRFISDAHGLAYNPLHSLEEARIYDDGIIVFEGDNGGQIYLVAPASQVMCSEKTLKHLLDQLDEIERPSGDGCEAHIYYERKPVGTGIPGGMGGGAVTGDIWLHPRIAQRGIDAAIYGVIAGRIPEIPPDIMKANVPPEPNEGIALTAPAFRDRMVAAIAQAMDKAQRDIAEPLPTAYRLRLRLFRQCGLERDATIDEAARYLYVDGTFPRGIGVSVLGIIGGETALSLNPHGRRYVRRVRDDGYYAGVVPFHPSGLVPIAWNRDRSPVTHERLAKVAAYLIDSADERMKRKVAGSTCPVPD